MYDFSPKIEKMMVVLTDPEEAKKRKYRHRGEIPKPTEKNKQIIESYYQEQVIKGYKEATIVNKLSGLRLFTKFYHRQFEEIKWADLKIILFKIETDKTERGTDRTPISKALHKQWIKDFLKFLFDEEYITEPLHERIHVKIPDTPVTADDIYTEDEVNAMINGALNLRDKAFIAFIYDIGGRIGEILPMKLKSVEQLDKALRVTVSGKTGTRTMLLDFSTFYMRQWLNAHPHKNNPEAYLWCHVKGDSMQQVEYITMLKNIKSIALKAGITKRIYNHAFRHSSVTRDAEHFSEALNKNKHGWTPSSKMLSRYTHINSANLEKAQLEKMGLAPTKIKREANVCPNCNEINPHDFKFCGKCGFGLSAEIRKEKENNVAEMMSIVMQSPEIYELFNSKLAQMQQ